MGILQHPCNSFVGNKVMLISYLLDDRIVTMLLGIKQDEEQNLETISSQCDDNSEKKTETLDCIKV